MPPHAGSVCLRQLSQPVRTRFETEVTNSSEIQTVTQLLEFLGKQCKIQDNVHLNKE